MIGSVVVNKRWGAWLLGLAVGIGLLAGAASARPGARPRPRRVPARVVTVREVIVRREPVVIQAVTLKQLRAELRRARLEHAGYERQIAGQYQTIRQLQARLDIQLRAAQETASHRAAQLNAQFEIILQAFGLVVFAIIGALLVALSRSHAASGRPAEAGPRPAEAVPPPAVDWDPLLNQLGQARSALASVEARLIRLEMSTEGSRQ
jgi:hypothetical protein